MGEGESERGGVGGERELIDIYNGRERERDACVHDSIMSQ